MELKESMHPKPKSDEDALTVELRNEFALLNKIVELREIARDTSKKKLSRTVAKAAITRLRKSKAKAPASKPAKVAGEWLKKLCWRCNATFSIHSEWDKPPSLCKACAKDLDETHLPTGPDHSTPFSKVHFVSGGAPGSGKRR